MIDFRDRGIRKPPQDEIRRSVALLLADSIRFTHREDLDFQYKMTPILRGLELLYRSDDITVEQESEVFTHLLETSWMTVPEFNPTSLKQMFEEAGVPYPEDDSV